MINWLLDNIMLVKLATEGRSTLFISNLCSRVNFSPINLSTSQDT